MPQRHFGEEVSKLVLRERRSQDHKTDLQEALQAVGLPVPVYRVASETGPGHRKTFVVELSVSGQVVATGTGTSKKGAEQEAARDLLARLDDVLPSLRRG